MSVDVKYQHCTAIYKEQAYLYYLHDKQLDGYFITSIAIADNYAAKKNFREVLVYFFTEIVRTRDVYCNLFENDLEFFSKYVSGTKEYNGMTIHKLNNFKDIVNV